MTSPGGIRIPITADGSTFGASLRDAVLDGMRTVQAELDLKPLDIKIDLDMAGAISTATTELAGANLTAHVGVDLDMAGAITAAETSLTGAGLTANVGVDLDIATAITAAETSLAGANLTAKATVDLDLNVTPEQEATLREIKTLTDKTVRVKVDLDMTQAEYDRLKEITPTLRALKNLTDTSVRVKVDLDMSQADLDRLKSITPAIRSLRNLTDTNVRVKVNLDMTDAELERLKSVTPALRGLKNLTDTNVRVRVRLEMSDAELERLKSIGPALAALGRLSDKDIKIKIDIQADDARLARLAELLREMRDRNVNARVDTDADTAADKFNRLSLSLGGIGGIAAGGAAALAAIGGAAGAAAGAVGGLVIGLAALGPAAAAIAGTALVAVSGVKDAFTAAAEAAENGPKEAEASARAVASAQNGVQSALDGATSAQNAYNAAAADLTDRNRDVADSFALAAEDLEDYQFKLRGSVIDQKEADLALREAQKAFREAMASGDADKREKALLRLESAQLRYDKAVDAGQDTAAEVADAEAKGIENSDRVVAARDAAAQAEQRVQDAARQSAAAQRAVVQAQAALLAAQTTGSPSAEKYAEAMAKLAPAAQEFVIAGRGLKPMTEELGRAVQQTTFQGWASTMTDVAGRVLPAVQTGMVGVAGELNIAGTSFANFLGSARGLEGLRSVFAGTTNLLAGMREGSGGFTQGLLDFVKAAEPAMNGIGQAIAGIGGTIGGVLSEAANSGALTSLFEGFRVALEGTGPLLGGLLSALITMANAVLPALGPLFEALGGALVAIAPALGDLGVEFARGLTDIMPVLGEFIRSLAEGLRPVLPVLVQLLNAALGALMPLIEPLAQIALVVGQALVDAIVALTPSIGPVADAFAGLITAIAPIIPLVAEGLSAVLVALAPALSQVFAALAPVIADLATQLRPVLEQIAPVLAEVAMTIGLALADAIRQLAPMLPGLVTAFANLLLAVVPILPEMVTLAAQVLPSLVNVLVELAPVTIKFIELLTWLAENVIIPVLIPAMRLMAEEATGALDKIAGAISWLKDTASSVFSWFTDTAFPALGSAWETVQGWFDTGVNAIASKFDRLREAAAVPVRFVVNTVFNEGLRKAWNAVNQFIPGAPELEPIQLGFARGGGVFGPGTGTSDSIPAWLSAGEHVITAAEVMKAGGQNILYAIRDMIARGVPFTWDGGRVIQDLGRDNLERYGAAVRVNGIGNVPPEGLFSGLTPGYRDGGEVMPWMHQLLRGHQFAKSQHGRPYQWAGPRYVGDSFDCSGFMGSIAAAILGLNVWQRYWATGNFSGQQVGPQGFTRNLLDAGMVVGISNGGEGGGHTAGVLGPIPLLGIPSPMRVESGGSIGGVHYGAGPDPRSFQMLYGLPIGANGFFQPGEGGSGSVGPSPADQSGFVQSQINKIFKEMTDPIRGEIESRIGPPPPLWNRVPGEFLTTATDKSVEFLAGLVDGLGDALPGAWTKAQELAGRAWDALTPFDSGGVASGVGWMPKNVLEPERVLDPTQTRLFEALVMALSRIAGGGGAPVTSVSQQQQQQQVEQTQAAIEEQGVVLADTRDLIARSESSNELVTAQQTAQLQAGLNDIADKLGFEVLAPVIQSGMDAAVGVVQGWLKGLGTQITAEQRRTTEAVQAQGTGTDAPIVSFGQPGSTFDAASEIGKAVTSIANAAGSAFAKVAQDVANAALAQQASRVQESRGRLGTDISGGPLVDLVVRLTGVEIEVRETLVDTLEEITRMRGSLIGSFDQSGRIVQDTAELMQRNESSRDLVISEQNRLNRELIKSVLRYLMTAVVIPIMTAVLGAMITLASTAIGAAIGSFIPVIGTAIGGAIGAVVGAALGGVAAVLTGALAVGAAAAIDSFDAGGVAVGKGFLAKDTVEPERVLSPNQTVLFERMVTALETGGRSGNRTVHAPMTVYERAGAGRRIQSDLLSLL